MREIKFRAWDKQHKIMEQVTAIIFNCNPIEIDIASSQTEPKSIEHFDLMQYTGRKDKNDVEIYEGDRIRCTHRGKHMVTQQATVKFYRGNFIAHIFTFDENIDDAFALSVYYELEVIGNIYEDAK